MKIVIVLQKSKSVPLQHWKDAHKASPTLNIAVKKISHHYNMSLHFMDISFFGNLQSPTKKRFELPEKYFPPSKEMILTHQRKSSLLRLLRSVPPPPSPPSVLSLFLFPKLISRRNVQPVPHYIFNSRKLKRKEQDLAILPFPWLILVHQDDGCLCMTEVQSSTMRERTKQWSQINTWSSFRIQGELNFLLWAWLMLFWTLCAMFSFQVVCQTLVPFSYSHMHLIN